MARARNIKPSFFTDGELTALEPLARLLFAGLWCLADKAGRLKDKPRDIKLQILPADNCDVEQLLCALSAHFITRYEVNGERYIQINRFTEHQNPHKNEAESGIPKPNQVITGNVSSNRADSLNSDSLNSDSLNSDSLTPSSEDAGAKCDEDLTTTQNLFDQFWRAYPKKRSKADALKAFKVLKPNKVFVQKMLSAIAIQVNSHDWQKEDGKYIPYPASWLRAGAWEDEVKPLKEAKAYTESDFFDGG